MFTVFSSDPVEFDFDEDIVDRYTNDMCPSLAYELHKLAGWTIAMLSSSPAGSPDYMGHVFVVDADGMAIDIKGKRSIEDIKNEWYFCGYLTRFWDLREFEYEMLEWSLSTRYDKDKQAKVHAKIIVERLR